ncbi:MAG: PepSY-like domain-containing protein [Tannerellaceae bacterium]
MKKLFTLTTAFVIIMLASWSCSSNNDVIVAFKDLPTISQEFINTYYPGVQVKSVLETKTQYEVDLGNGAELDFDKTTGEWQEIDDANGIPSGIIDTLPQNISTFLLDEGLLDDSVFELSRTSQGGYMLQLDNGLKLKFDADGNNITM